MQSDGGRDSGTFSPEIGEFSEENWRFVPCVHTFGGAEIPEIFAQKVTKIQFYIEILKQNLKFC